MMHLARAFLLLILASPSAAQPAAPQPQLRTAAVAPDRAGAVRALAARELEAQKLVALSIVVAQDGAIVLEEHLGFEDREAGVPAAPRTMYRWASISKPVTAVAAMQLVQDAKLDLDADVRTLVPEFPEKPWKVTPRQLLCHQGGVVHYNNGQVIKSPLPAAPEHPYEDVIVALGAFKESPLLAEPGTKYSYTTHGYMLLGAAVERAAGVKFWLLIRDRIAVPAGMTTFRPDYQWEKIEHRAVGYKKDKEGEVVRSIDTDVSWKLPGGGFISTAGDLSRFSIALMGGKLVTPETFRMMQTPQPLKDGEPTSYGVGLDLGQVAGKPAAWHAGSQEKAATYLLMLTGERFSVAVMCSTEGASLGGLSRAITMEWLGIDAPGKPSR